METFNDAQGTPLYYVVYLEPEGFVIVAADDLVEPIIGFAPSGQFDPSTDNPLGALVSRDLPGRIAKVKTIQAAQAPGLFLAAKNKWGQLKSIEQMATGIKLGIPSVSDVRVMPLTQTTWNQSTVSGNACYNYYTPPNAEGSAANYVCGCVATAMAQLMRFWQYPVNGVGTASFTIYVTDVAQSRSLRGGNGAGGPYDWSNMVLSPSGSSTLTQRQAIGALCADAGVSVHMQYNLEGSGQSGAYMQDVQGSLVNTFGYAHAICGENGMANIGAGLNGMVNPNLDAGYPVLFGIRDESSGHAIVCDGYGYNLSTLYHHLNLGWSGSYTAWYNLPNIDAGYAFNTIDACIYNVWTNGSGEIVSGRVTDGAGTPLAGVAVTATRSGGGTYTATSNTRGIYALAKIPAASTYTVSASKAGYTFTEQIVTTGQSTDYSAASGNKWAVDFVPSDANNPTGFSATPVSPSRIDLAWGKNPSGDNVMVAWNTSATFGTPSGAYSVGGSISGGGTVLYNGSATSVSHTGLAAGTKYYYKTWSVRSGPSYSSGVPCSATTTRGVPFIEGFENGGSIPDGWTQEYITGTVNWTFQSGSTYGYPASAHGGSYNALLYFGASSDHKTKLVTPMIDFGMATQNAQLTFWHYMEVWLPDQDELRVYFKTSASNPWNLLATYTSSVTSWTQRTISLPSPNSTYFIAFEGNAKYGYGVCIDDVVVTAQSSPPTISQQPQSTNVSAGATATFSITATGTGPLSYQWQTNNVNISNGGHYSGVTSNVLSVSPAGVTDATNYRCVVSNAGGSVTSAVATLTVNLQTPFQTWQLDYFGCTNCSQAADTADPDGDGSTNLKEFLTGTDPTNGVSCWRIQASPTNGAPNLTVSFTENSSSSSITNRLWSFGDGGVGSGTNPSHTYTNAGTFSVSLTIFNLYGTATLVAANLITVSQAPAIVNIEAANLQDGSGNLASTSSVVVLVADTGDNGFADPQPGFPLILGATWGTDNKVVGLWDLRDALSCSGNDGGALCGQTIVAYTNGIAPGQKLQLYWFPSLTLASSALGITTYGKYTDTNSPPLDGSDAWETPASGSEVVLRFYTAYWGGSNPDTAGRATLLTAAPTTTVYVTAANLQDALGGLASSNSVVVLVIDTGNNGFADPQTGFSLSAGAVWGTDDKVVGLWDMRDAVNCSGNDGGALCGETVVSCTGGIASGQKLQLYWFPSLTLASNTLGFTSYGKYTDPIGIDGSDAWKMPVAGSPLNLWFLTAYWGGSNPETAGRATLVTAGSPFAAWQQQYFGCTTCPEAAEGADPDGDGQNNLAEFLAGTVPTSSASAFRITAVACENNNLRVTWTMGSDKTNALQATAGEGNGSYSTNNFSDIFTVTNTVGSLTNYLDVGAATNFPSRFYRIRLVP